MHFAGLGVLTATCETKLAMTHTSITSCPSLLQHCSRLQCPWEGGEEGEWGWGEGGRGGRWGHPEWHFTLLHRGPVRPLPLLSEWSAPIPARWSLVKDQPCAPRTFTGSRSLRRVSQKASLSLSTAHPDGNSTERRCLVAKTGQYSVCVMSGMILYEVEIYE